MRSPHPQSARSPFAPDALLGHAAGLPRMAQLALGLALIAAIAVLDYATGPRILLSIFYLLPVMLVAWGTESTGYGLVAALAAFIVSPLEAAVTGFQPMSLPVALWNGVMRLAVFCIVLYLMQEVRELVDRLAEAARLDELTGLANLRAFREVAEREVERSRRFGHALSLAYVDIDDFKATNDRLGHDAGDRALISLASVALATVRSVDTVARIGGDEFVIVMPETAAEAALPLVTRLRDSFARVAMAPGGDGRATCSVGLASYERAPASADEMLAAADALMYAAKEAGKDRVRHASLRPGAPGVPAHGSVVPLSKLSRS